MLLKHVSMKKSYHVRIKDDLKQILRCSILVLSLCFGGRAVNSHRCCSEYGNIKKWNLTAEWQLSWLSCAAAQQEVSSAGNCNYSPPVRGTRFCLRWGLIVACQSLSWGQNTLLCLCVCSVLFQNETQTDWFLFWRKSDFLQGWKISLFLRINSDLKKNKTYIVSPKSKEIYVWWNISLL